MRKNRLKLGLAFGVAVVVPFVVSCAARRVATTPQKSDPQAITLADTDNDDDAISSGEEGNRVPPALKRKLAAAAKAAPSVTTEAIDDPESYADQDWLEHSMDGAGNGPPPFEAFATARNDWF